MTESALDLIWETMERSLINLEKGEGKPSCLALAARDALVLALEYLPAELITRVEASSLPARALMSWLVFEADQLGPAGKERAAALRDCWRAAGARQPSLIEPALLQAVA